MWGVRSSGLFGKRGELGEAGGALRKSTKRSRNG